MAPPLGSKRALPPEPPDAGNRVSKPKPTSGKSSRENAAKTHLLPKTVDASSKGFANEKVPSEGQGSTEYSYESDDSIESVTDDIRDHKHINEDFPVLPGSIQVTDDAKTPSPSDNSSSKSQGSAASIMGAIKGLLDLTNDYLKNLETQHPGIGSDFLALIADGASRAMRGERVYRDLSKIEPTRKHPVEITWATKAIYQSAGTKVSNLKRKTLKASPPQGQSKEDRRVMIRLKSDHEARKSGSFELRQTIQKLVPESSLVSDAWIVPSGIAVLAPTSAKAAAILQAKQAIEDRFGNALVERQEAWTTFVIGPINKRIRCLDGTQDPMDGLLQEELAHIRDAIPIRDMGWTRRFQNDEPYGYIRICVPESKAGKFLSRLRIFGEAVSIQRIRKRGQIVVCTKCHGFHTARTCARSIKCLNCGMEAHDGSCDRTSKCLNCLEPHCSNDPLCPARPRHLNGVFVRPTGVQLKHIRAAGRREFLKANKQEAGNSSPSTPPSGTAETEITPSLSH